jgi:TonB family protein
MLHEEQGTGNPLQVAERRAHTRLDLTSMMYVDMGNVNGGVISNISESGLALTTAMRLSAGPLPAMRIRLPGSVDWTEINGRIAWSSKSGKLSGIEFSYLTEDTRQRIRELVASEGRLDESSHSQTSPAQELESSVGAMVAQALGSPIAESLAPVIATHENPVENAVVATESAGTVDDTPPNEDSTETPDRRVHPRRALVPIGFLVIGSNNSGIFLDISEGGLTLTAAFALDNGHVTTVRFQLPGSEDLIEASGQIAWISESRKKGGLRFAGLTDEARQHIRSWVSQEVLPAENHPETHQVREQSDLVSEEPRVEASMVSVSVSPAPVENAVEPVMEIPVVAPVAAPVTAPTLQPHKPPVAIPTSWDKAKLKKSPMPRHAPIKISGRNRMLGIATTALVCTVALSAVVGQWFSARRRFQDERTLMVAEGTTGSSSTQNTVSPPVSATPTVESPRQSDTNLQATPPKTPPAETNSAVSDMPPQDVRPPDRKVEPLLNLNVNRRNLPTADLPSRKEAAKIPQRTVPTLPPVVVPPVTAPSPAVQTVPVQAKETMPASQPAPVTASSDRPPAEAVKAEPLPQSKSDEALPSTVKPPEAAPMLVGSVAVSANPYPSIRVPRTPGSQKSQQGRALQIGHLVSRVEPVYPEEAIQQGIQGTVVLHALVGPEGNVETIELVSGPSTLLAPAQIAVQAWRYSPTLVDGHPVETEEDISVTFRLSTAAISKN